VPVTVSETVVVRVSAPETPVTVTLVVPVAAVAPAVKVRVEVVVPFAGGVAGLGTKAAVTPDGSAEVLSVTAELKPFVLVIVTVLLPEAPCATLTDVPASEKSGVGVAVTVRPTFAERVSAPLVPTAWNVVVPAAAVPALTVSVLLTVPFAGGVIDEGAKLQDAPAARLAHESATALAKPPVDVTVQVVLALAPCWMLRLAGAQEML
jgi:hypothetical protein